MRAAANPRSGKETFQFSGDRCLPAVNSIPAVSLTATYNTNGSWETSTSATIVQIVNGAQVNTTTILNSSDNPSTSGQSVTFQALVKPVSGTGVATGTVKFRDGGTLLGSGNLVSGAASFLPPASLWEPMQSRRCIPEMMVSSQALPACSRKL
jgi:hypothetical protein